MSSFSFSVIVNQISLLTSVDRHVINVTIQETQRSFENEET